jgi:hypothetical protein
MWRILSMGYYDYVVKAILLLIMAIAVLRTVGKEKSIVQNWASHILTVILIVMFVMWMVDTTLWLGVEILQSPLVKAFFTQSDSGTIPPNIHL